MSRFFLLLSVLMAMSHAPMAVAISEGDVFPNVKIAGTTGDLDADSMKGKVTIINFWATWCEACKVELKEMEHKFAAYSSNQDVRIAFVSMDKDPSKATEWVLGNLKTPTFVADRLFMDSSFAAAEALGIDSFPMTVIVDQQQKIHYIQRGFKEGDQSTDRMVALINSILAKPAAH